MAKGGNIGNTLVDGAATYGRFMAIIGLIVASLIALVLICIAVYIFTHPSKYTKSVQGTITEATCETRNNNVKCDVVVKYNVGEKNMSGSTTTNNKFYKVGNTISLVYDPTNPQDVVQKRIGRKIVALILILSAIILMIISILHFYIVNRFKFAATASAYSTVL